MQLFIAAIYIRNPNLYMCPFRKRNYKTDRNGNSLRSVAAFLSLIKATLFYSAIFVPSFIVTVPMSGTFALPLTEVSVKSSSIWASLPRSSRAVTVADR